MNIDQFLTERRVAFGLIPHRETHGAQRLAATIHVTGCDVAKTVLLRADHGYKYIVAVLPANRDIDFGRVSQAFGGSELKLATEEEISAHCPDCEFGALPPFGSQYCMKTIADERLANGEFVFEGNTHHEAIRMSFDDFLEIEHPLVVDISAQSPSSE